MLLPPSPIWHTVNPQGKLTATQDEFRFAGELLEKESEEYERSQADKGFIQKILSAGTTTDKLSTLTLLAQQSPVHNTKALHSLLQLAQKKSRTEALKALRAFADWWTAGGTPDRKLRFWADQPAKATSDAQRILYYFEDWLKKLFWDFLQTLERLSLDPLSYVRTQATTLIHTLLTAKPEQEHNLLRLLVNKLGDSSKQLASRTSYHILQLLESHPAMKGVVVSEIASLILRAPLSTSAKIHVEKSRDSGDINSHARYYATITLNQLVLSHSGGDAELARKLIQIYFDMFTFLLRVQEGFTGKEKDGRPHRVKGRTEMRKDKSRRQEKEERVRRTSTSEVKENSSFIEIEHGHERFVSAILTGLHRAIPYASLDASSFEKHTNTLFKLTHESTFSISLQALLLIQSLLSCAPVASTSQDNTTGSLPMTSNIQTRFLRTTYASLHDPRLRGSSKKSLYLNLLLKVMNQPYHSSSALAIRHNTSELKIRRAFWRRLIAVALTGTGMAGENEVVCGSMYVLGDVASRDDNLKRVGKEVTTSKSIQKKKREQFSTTDPLVEPEGGTEEYDPRKREPEFARADMTPLWELTTLAHHYHPSVSLHARQLLEGRPVTANADLSLNTLSHFLDRFVYKNPKKPTERGVSSMQPSSSQSATKSSRDRGVTVGNGATLEGMMNEEQFRKRKIGSIPADQVFFHKFFSKKHELDMSRAKQVRTKKTSDDTEVDALGEDAEDDEQEEEIWKAMQATMPRAGDEGDELMVNDSDDSELDHPASDDDESDQAADAAAILTDEEDAGEFEFAESDNDLLDSDADLPGGILFDPDAVSGPEAEGEEDWGGVDVDAGQKRKTKQPSTPGDQGTKGGVKKKRKLKHLPMFASMEDYAQLIDQSPEDNI